MQLIAGNAEQTSATINHVDAERSTAYRFASYGRVSRRVSRLGSLRVQVQVGVGDMNASTEASLTCDSVMKLSTPRSRDYKSSCAFRIFCFAISSCCKRIPTNDEQKKNGSRQRAERVVDSAGQPYRQGVQRSVRHSNQSRSIHFAEVLAMFWVSWCGE